MKIEFLANIFEWNFPWTLEKEREKKTKIKQMCIFVDLIVLFIFLESASLHDMTCYHDHLEREREKEKIDFVICFHWLLDLLIINNNYLGCLPDSFQSNSKILCIIFEWRRLDRAMVDKWYFVLFFSHERNRLCFKYIFTRDLCRLWVHRENFKNITLNQTT